jgi:hypothetical protein
MMCSRIRNVLHLPSQVIVREPLTKLLIFTATRSQSLSYGVSRWVKNSRAAVEAGHLISKTSLVNHAEVCCVEVCSSYLTNTT